MSLEIDEKLIFRLWAKDRALFTNKPMLDWLDEPENILKSLPTFTQVAGSARARFQTIILLGMGGSSASVKMFKEMFAPKASFYILDTINPDDVERVEKKADLKKTLFIVASKSGSTMEPWLLYQHFLKKLESKVSDPFSHFMAITDPISALEQESVEKGFLHAPLGRPGIGGRYSGLSVFGMLPALMMGIDIKTILDSAILMAKKTSFSVNVDDNPSVSLAKVIAAHDQKNLFIYISKNLWPMKQWLEQLIAESLGKDGRGMVPIITDDAKKAAICLGLTKELVATNALNIAIDEKDHIGGLMFCWQMAVALAGIMLNIDPFDQPDVERSKVLTKEIIADLKNGQKIDQDKPDFENADFKIYGHIKPEQTGYFAVLSYLSEDERTQEELLNIKEALPIKDAVIIEQGPCYLHSTGQLFKGGINSGQFLMLTYDPSADFLNADGHLSMAQIHLSEALGDLKALLEKGRKVVRIHLKTNLSSQKLIGELCKSH